MKYLRVSICLAALTLLTAIPVFSAPSPSAFVKVDGTRFTIEGTPLRFVGANLWYGMNLASTGPGGDRERLVRELDRLQTLGVTNLRILGASEGPNPEPWRIAPALQPQPGVFDPLLLEGLDFLLVEMGKRDLRAVICLNNFWPWSGGMAQYVRWSGGEPIPYPPPAEGGSWETFQKYSARFYSNETALLAAENTVRTLVTRINSITSRKYAEDPVIMAWQLANEPRGIDNGVHFARWIERTSALIKNLDPRHLVTLGAEGETPSPQSAGVDFVANHKYSSIDYTTAHIWAQNWGWFDPQNADATYDNAVLKMRAYIADHTSKAALLGKPLVIEEFGLARDLGSHDPASSTSMRDRYFAALFSAVYQQMSSPTPVLSGINFWAWAGEGRPRSPAGGIWHEGDSWVGDPPHEPQGWYGVYDSDKDTQATIFRFSQQLKEKR